MTYYVKESISTGESRYWERAIRRSPFQTLEQAKKYADSHRKNDNQPFVINNEGAMVHVCPKGRDYK